MAYPSPISGCSTSGLCNLTLGEASPMFQYTPIRDGPAQAGWNASFTGSTVYDPQAGAAGIGSAYRLTSLDQAAFKLIFDGPAIYLCLAMSPGATYTLTVDGQQYNTTAPPTDPACFGDVGVQTVAFADVLSRDSPQGHSVEFTANLPGAGDALSFYGAVVTLDVAPNGYKISDPIYVDDTNPGWSYLGANWVPASGDDPGNYNNTHTYNCVYSSGSVATYTVPPGAAALLLMGTVEWKTFAYSISFDDMLSVYNSTNVFKQDGTVLFFASELDPTREHVITVTDFDANDEAGQGAVPQCLSIDLLLIFNASAPLPETSTMLTSTPSSQPTVSPTTSKPSQSATPSISRGAIAGIVVGSLFGLLLLVLLVWLFRHRLSRMARVTSDRVAITGRNFLTPRPYIVDQGQGVSNGASTSQDGAVMREVSPRPGLAIVESPTSKRNPLSRSSTQSRSGVQLQPTMAVDTHDTPSAPALERASTFDLVQVLNLRLHNEQMDNIEEPPDYPQSRRLSMHEDA